MRLPEAPPRAKTALSRPPSAHVSDQAAAAIPADIRAKARWHCWKYIPPKLDGANWPKPSIDYQGKPFDQHNPEILMAFEKARARSIGIGDGVGYRLDVGEVGVDLDDCFDEQGNLKPSARAIVDALNSYTERTPSHKGLHIIVRARKPGSKCRCPGIEIYDHTGNYLTFTGNHFVGTPTTIEPRQQALDALYAAALEEIPTGGGGVYAAQTQPGDLTDDEIIEKARQSQTGREFIALFDQGDLGLYNNDKSTCDYHLCRHLAYWTGKDAARMEAIFDRSKLAEDEKWSDRPDYRRMTIAAAIAKTRKVYTASANGAPASKNGKPNPPRRVLARPDYDDSDSPINRTELGNARRLVKLFGHRLRYCKQLGYWLVFDGTRWRQDHTGEVWRCAKATVRALGKEAARMTDDTKRTAMLAWALESEKKKSIQAMIDLAWSEPGIAIVPEDLDSDHYLLNCPNGTVDLRTGKLRQHRAEDLITKITSFAYRRDAPRKRWENTLAEILPESELVAYVKRAIGYSASGDTGEHALFIPWGTGRNGKNTVLDPVKAVLNDYADGADPKIFLRTGKNEHPTGLAGLFGRRCIVTDEVDEGEQLAEALVKRVTGNPKLNARFICKDYFEFLVTFKLWMPVNHKPDIKGRDEGIWSRIRLIPFDVYFPPDKRIKNLARILVREEGEGILAWIVEGYIEWQKDGLKEPEKVIEAVKEYRREQDVVTDFIEQCCKSWLNDLNRDQIKTKPADLYTAYTAWCKENGEKTVLTSRKFGNEMTAKGYELKPSNSVQYRHGISLTHAATTTKPETEASG